MSRSGKKSTVQRQRSKRITQHHHVHLSCADHIVCSVSDAMKYAGSAAGAITLVAALNAPSAHALPQNGSVVGGTATITQPSASSMTINQTSPRTVINWQGYSIGVNEAVRYFQPGSGSIALNRVTGQDASYIYGKLSGNGQIWVINPNGLLVGPGAQVQTGGFLASTMNITNGDFMKGTYRFTGTPDSVAGIKNQGNILVSDGGYVVLAAPTVVNEGTISATLGKVHLASGDQVTLTVAGSDLLDLVVSGKAAAEALGVNNRGVITADGGQVVLSARVAGDLLRNVVNNEGIIRARSIVEKNGTIILDGGDLGITANSGTMDVSGRNAGETGGTVKVLGDKVGLFAGSNIDASGAAGGGTVLVGGNFQGKGPEQNAAMTYVDKDAVVSADAVTSGNGGKVVVWGNDSLQVHGSVSARGGSESGNGGFVETSSHGDFSVTTAPNVRAVKGKGGQWLIDPLNLTINNTAPDTNVTELPPFTWKPNGGAATITWATIDGAAGTGLSGGDVTVTTVGTVGGGNGDITIGAPGTLNNGNKLTISAANDILVNNFIKRTVVGNLDLTASRTVSVGADISLTGASSLTLTATTGKVDQTAGTISANGGVTISTTLDGVQAAGAVIAGTGGLTKLGAGTLTLSGANTYSGGTAVSAGTLTGTTTSLQGNITDNALVVFDQAVAGSYGGAISGTGAVTKQGAGNVTLSNSNSYTGGTNVNVGTLTLGHATNTLADTGAVNVNGGTLDIGANSDTVGAVTLASGSITGATGVLSGTG